MGKLRGGFDQDLIQLEPRNLPRIAIVREQHLELLAGRPDFNSDTIDITNFCCWYTSSSQSADSAEKAQIEC